MDNEYSILMGCFLCVIISFSGVFYIEYQQKKINRLIEKQKKVIRFRDNILRLIILYDERRVNLGLPPDGLVRFELPRIDDLYASNRYVLSDWYTPNQMEFLMGDRIV